MIEFPRTHVFIPRDKPRDEGIDWWQRSWFLLSRELHEKDHGKRMYLPTPRGCPGLKRQSDWPDRIVFWGCVAGFAVLILWRYV